MNRSTSRIRVGSRRRTLAVLGAGLAAATVAGCASGQIAETAQINSSVHGAHATVHSIALRNVEISYPQSGQYQRGQDARLTLVLVNSGLRDDALTDVRTDAAKDVTFGVGGPVLTPSALPTPVPTGSAGESASPTGTAGGSASGTPSASPTATPTNQVSDLPVPANSSLLAYGAGPRVTLVGLTDALRVAESLKITFTFREAGQVTIVVPVGLAETPPPPPPAVDVEPTAER